MSSWKSRWGCFLSVMTDPWTLCLLGLTLALTWVATTSTINQSWIPVFLNSLVAIFAGILGARIWEQWTDYTGAQVLTSRGRAAVRALRLLLNRTKALEDRIVQMHQRHLEKALSGDVIAMFLEEARGSCQSLLEQTVTSMENWIDIVPEADVRSQIGVISALNHELQQRIEEKSALEKTLSESKGQSNEETKRLRDKIAEKDKKISELQTAQTLYEITTGSGGPGFNFSMPHEQFQLAMELSLIHISEPTRPY